MRRTKLRVKTISMNDGKGPDFPQNLKFTMKWGDVFGYMTLLMCCIVYAISH